MYMTFYAISCLDLVAVFAGLSLVSSLNLLKKASKFCRAYLKKVQIHREGKEIVLVADIFP